MPMLMETGSTPKEAAICGSDVVTMVPSSTCMKNETATTKATIRGCRPKLSSEGWSVVGTAVMAWNFGVCLGTGILQRGDWQRRRQHSYDHCIRRLSPTEKAQSGLARRTK